MLLLTRLFPSWNTANRQKPELISKMETTMDRKDSLLVKLVSIGWPNILASLKSLLETGEALEASDRWPEGI
jgi:hypothetical protein